MRIVTFFLLAAVLFMTQGVSERVRKPNVSTNKSTFKTNLCVAKGGIGIIRRDDLYVELNSAKNTLLLSGEEKWTGLNASKPEVAIFFDKKVWLPQNVPDGFDLSEAVVISFEADKVRFFDFTEMDGGFYLRPGHPIP